MIKFQYNKELSAKELLDFGGELEQSKSSVSLWGGGFPCI